MPPVRSGIAACSAELVPALRAAPGVSRIDVFVDEPVASAGAGLQSAHEFLWRHRESPYDLTVYQVGNSSHHDYLWPYLFRFPGLTVLHDAHLHHARAAVLLRTARAGDYRSEFVANHPEAPADAAELAVAGFDSHLYYLWPMARLAAQASRLTAVHSRQMADRMRTELDIGHIEYLRLSQGALVTGERERRARATVRARYGIDPEAVTFGCFGGLTPDKRLPQILEAFAAMLRYAPDARLVLAGAGAAHYDLPADVRVRGLTNHVVLTDYLDGDEELTDCIAAVDVTLHLRWPTAREISGPWLRCLAAGKPTIVMDLLQLVDVPTIDPRTWMPNAGGAGRAEESVAVAIDILDEVHSLSLAMCRLAWDAALRRTLGASARHYWLREHSLAAMVNDYLKLMQVARSMPAPMRSLPDHLVDDGTRLLQRLVAPFGIAAPLA